MFPGSPYTKQFIMTFPFVKEEKKLDIQIFVENLQS